MIDSALGATVQFTGHNRETRKVTSRLGPHVSYIAGLPFLTNAGVNAAACLITAALFGGATALGLIWR